MNFINGEECNQFNLLPDSIEDYIEKRVSGFCEVLHETGAVRKRAGGGGW